MRHFKAHLVRTRADVDEKVNVDGELGVEVELSRFDELKVVDERRLLFDQNSRTYLEPRLGTATPHAHLARAAQVETQRARTLNSHEHAVRQHDVLVLIVC